jgi:hypothetical protein
MSLIKAFLFEISLPQIDIGWTVIKYETISLFPNLPCCNDEGFHKEVVIEITSSHLHHLEEWCSKLPLKTNQLPVTNSLFVWLVVDGWCWFVLREKYCWLFAGGWFALREKYCWLVADKPSEQGAITMDK